MNGVIILKRTIKECADEYGVTKSAIFSWINDGLNYTTERVIGKKKMFIVDTDEVETYLKSKADTYKKGKNTYKRKKQ